MITRVFVLLVIAYFLYSFTIYFHSTRPAKAPAAEVQRGFAVWQQHNCQGCHQLYGLGGYMGPDLTNLMSDPAKGRIYAYAFIKGGSQRMPNFRFTDKEVNEMVAFLSWVDQSGRSVVPAEKVTWLGNYELENN